MDAQEILQRLAPFVSPGALSARQIEQISMYIDMLLRWNRKINLTAVRKPDEIVSRHFGESLFAAQHLLPVGRRSVRAIDVGSGAGFPGLAMKIFAPEIQLTLVESSARKAAFLREVVRALQLADAEVLAGRAEQYSGQAALVTMRAAEKFEKVLPEAGRLVEPGGRLALWIGARQVESAKRSLAAFAWEPPLLFPGSDARVLLVGRNQGS
jgi:16S rRNA (guanine527-N7)-methyltransferase